MTYLQDMPESLFSCKYRFRNPFNCTFFEASLNDRWSPSCIFVCRWEGAFPTLNEPLFWQRCNQMIPQWFDNIRAPPCACVWDASLVSQMPHRAGSIHPSVSTCLTFPHPPPVLHVCVSAASVPNLLCSQSVLWTSVYCVCVCVLKDIFLSC